jgi:hypothetical protein
LNYFREHDEHPEHATREALVKRSPLFVIPAPGLIFSRALLFVKTRIKPHLSI